MNILNIPYFAGGLSHLIPLYVLHHKYIRNNVKINNQFMVNNHLQVFLKMQGVDSVAMNYFSDDDLKPITDDNLKTIEYVMEKEKEAFKKSKPNIIIEDNSFTTPLIAEKNKIPRISIQRTGNFRSIDKSLRNSNHVHSMEKGSHIERSKFFSNPDNFDVPNFDDFDTNLLQHYSKPKAKIIPGIPSIEQLPNDIEDRKSYFYSGPLIVTDKPSKNLSNRLEKFLSANKQKPLVFITTGTIDKTPIERFIKYFIEKNYAVITTCNCEINETNKESIFYNKLLPLHYICSIANLIFHQCGSGMYHYPIMNKKPSLTIGTQCYDREDVAQRLQQLGVSGHIPHPDDSSDYWEIFIEKMNQFENDTLVDYKMMDQLKTEIDETMSNFDIEKVIEYALT